MALVSGRDPQLFYKRPVDFQRTERQFWQVTQAGVPSAEVVDSETYSQNPQALHGFSSAFNST
jgi:hypothetical protein